MLEVGSQVVCVDDTPLYGNNMGGLTKGRIYTVRWAGLWGLDPWYDEQPAVRLVEITASVRSCSLCRDIPYRACRFRPVRKTSIEIFQKMLAPTPERETV